MSEFADASSRQRGGDEELLPPGWKVETLEERDLDEVLAIERASFSKPWSRDMFLWELQNSGVSYGFVLRDAEGGVAGFCTAWIVQDELHVNNVAVGPEHRGKRLGLGLLRYVMRLASGLGARRATLEVRRSNTPALKLYERLGFEVVGTRRNYYSEPVEDALILWCDRLSPAP